MENSEPERDDVDTSTGADPVEQAVGHPVGDPAEEVDAVRGPGSAHPVEHPVEETEEYARAVDDDSVLPDLSVDPPPGPGPQRPKG